DSCAGVAFAPDSCAGFAFALDFGVFAAALAARLFAVVALTLAGAAESLEDSRSARLELRRTGRVRGRLVMMSRSESSRSGTMRMMARALRRDRPPRETKGRA